MTESSQPARAQPTRRRVLTLLASPWPRVQLTCRRSPRGNLDWLLPHQVVVASAQHPSFTDQPHRFAP
jgi:hypothetical protein